MNDKLMIYMENCKAREYVDFQVAPWAMPKVCEALWNNGVKDGVITLEDGELHVRWELKADRWAPRDRGSETGCRDSEGGTQATNK